jgi:tetratricopeptide (TPR) repeat protein
MALASVAIAALFLPCTVLAQKPSIPNPAEMGPTGTVTVSVRNEQGATISLNASVTIATQQGGTPSSALAQTGGTEWVFTELMPGQTYVVKVEAPGFKTAEQYVELPYVRDASVRVAFYLVPEKSGNGEAKAAGGAILAPRAQKEVQQGIKDLEENKISSAQKHLAKALKMAPGNPLVNYLMGECWLRAGKEEEAARYLVNALSLDPKQTHALLALGTLRYKQGNMAQAIEMLKRAVDSAPKLWQAHWLLAGAFLREGNYQQASEHAEAALKYGKEQADSARVILGMALAKLGKRKKALAALNEYVTRHPGDRDAEQVRGLIEKLRQSLQADAAGTSQAEKERPEAEVASVGAKTYAPEAKRSAEPRTAADLIDQPILAGAGLTPPAVTTVPAKASWFPPDIDAEKPGRISDATCRLPQILKESARHAEDLVSNLEKFSATEDYQEVEINRNGELRRPLTQEFSYLVFIQHIRPHLISVDEMRTPDPAQYLPGVPLITTGSVALALAFHPDFSGYFDWKCEGMGEWKGEPAWMIHFEQRADRPTSLLQAFISKTSGEYALPLKGRAWVAANGGHLLHLETDLVKPLEQVRLQREHFAIDFGQVKFHSHPVVLWLPKSVDAYFLYRGHTYHEYSRFSNFELFWVGTAEKIGKPKEKPPKP